MQCHKNCIRTCLSTSHSLYSVGGEGRLRRRQLCPGRVSESYLSSRGDESLTLRHSVSTLASVLSGLWPTHSFANIAIHPSFRGGIWHETCSGTRQVCWRSTRHRQDIDTPQRQQNVAITQCN